MAKEIVEIFTANGASYEIGQNNIVELKAITGIVGGIPFHYEAIAANGHRVKIFDFARVVYGKQGEGKI